MSKQVISFEADAAYHDHARSVMTNCRRQGGWHGDFCMISPMGSDTSDFEQRGIHVLNVQDEAWDFMVKFHAFTKYFRRWDQALCIDLDIMVQRNLHDLFDELTPRLPAILCVQEDGPILDGLKYWDKQSGEGPDAHPELYDEIGKRFPHVIKRMFNMAFIFYQPSSMHEETMGRLRALHMEFEKTNPSKADQMLVNLLLYHRLEEAGKDACCFFGSDYPECRVKSDYRGWTGEEHPAIIHFTRWSAQWIVKQTCDSPEPNTEPGGYRNHRLGGLCHELYAEWLAAFNEEFPVK